MRSGKSFTAFLCFSAILLLAGMAAAISYRHGGDTDSDRVREVYPQLKDTKLDSCALCHTGGKEGKTQLGSCAWCHVKFGYDGSGDINQTLNPYGIAFWDEYKDCGGSPECKKAAIVTIESLDSDGDGFSNKQEIDALRYPGDGSDDPTKVNAPYRVLSMDELKALPQHKQMLLMNTHKSGDFYAEYEGVTVEDVLKTAKVLDSATGIQALSPDGYSTSHPLVDSNPFDPVNPLYPVYGEYPDALFYYDRQADTHFHPLDTTYPGWCDYSAIPCEGNYPECLKSLHETLIVNTDGLKLIMAMKIGGKDLEPGKLVNTNKGPKLEGEGPYRLVPPQRVPGPPDQSSTVRKTTDEQDIPWIWPFDETADHNAGFSPKTVTRIKVEPLPEGTTDVDTLEAGWAFVNEGKILVYGAIDPTANIIEKIDGISNYINSLDSSAFKKPAMKKTMLVEASVIRKLVEKGNADAALAHLENGVMKKTDGCNNSGAVDENDWLTSCNVENSLYWLTHEAITLTRILQ